MMDLLEKIAHRITLSWGWPRRAIAFGVGAIGALALPPVDFGLAMIVPMTIAVWLIDGVAEETRVANMRTAFAVGWWWGLGYFIAGLWWLGAAFYVEGTKFLWALPLGVLGLPMLLAVFPGLGFALARAFWFPGNLRPLILAVSLSVSEFARAHLFTGFAWNEYGMTLGAHVVSAQVAAYGGLHSLTLLTVLLCAVPATLPQGGRMSLAAVTMCGLLLVFGVWRIAQALPPAVSGVKLRLIQANIDQGADFVPANGPTILSHYLTLSDRATSPQSSGIADVTHLFWPESPFPFILAQNHEALRQIADFLRGGATLITGTVRAEREEERTTYFNAIQIFNRSGLTASRYDKHHLVPFGEYVPLQNMLQSLGIESMIYLPGGFDEGKGSHVLTIAGLPKVLPMICYEAIFPNDFPTRGWDKPPVGLIVNVTDDAWFGHTAGPYQHFAQARLRAIELGLPMVRIANTGISAIIDARGGILKEAPLGVEAVLDSSLPGALPPTWQARFGSLPFFILLSLCISACIMRHRVSRFYR